MKTTTVNGFVFPGEAHGVKGQFTRLPDLDVAMWHCREFRVAVQAGGNAGVWPSKLAERFGAVYTFEPAAENFACLAANCPSERIFKFQAALGDRRKRVELAYDPDPKGRRFMGRGFVSGPGLIPILRIDDLGLDACDLVQLDVEGYEPEALLGGWETIRAHRPVVMLEDKGHSERYGRAAGWPESMLADLGYRVRARAGEDVILAPGC